MDMRNKVLTVALTLVPIRQQNVWMPKQWWMYQCWKEKF